MSGGVAASDVRGAAPAPPRWTRWIPGLTAGLVAGPVIVDVLVSDRSRPFGHLAADAFYYLTVARNMATRGISSFDGELATNGYHPLWQWICAGLYAGNDALTGDESRIFILVVLTCAVLVGLGIHWLARAVTREGGPAPGLLLVPVGVVALMMAPMWLSLGRAGVIAQSPFEGGRPLWATSWNFINGMESGVVLFCYGLLAWRHVQGLALAGRGASVGFGLLLAGLTLARLDHGLVAAPVAVGVALEGWRKKQVPKARIIEMLVAFAAPVLAYLLANWLLFGALLPVSGTLKSSIPRVTGNLGHLRELLGGRARGLWLARAARAWQMLAPVALALVWLPLWLRLRARGRVFAPAAREGRGRLDAMLGYTAIGVLALGVYNYLFVLIWHQGSWYYPVSTTFATLVVIRAWTLLVARRMRPRPRLSAIGALACAGLSPAAFLGLTRQPVRVAFADFYYEEAPRIRAHYGDTRPRLLSYDDGIVAFSTGFPTMSAFGYALDNEGVRARKSGRLFDLAMQRGHDRITSLAYFPHRVLGEGVERRARQLVRGHPVRLRGRALRAHRFEVEYRSASGRFVIVRARAYSGSGARPREPTRGPGR